MLILLYWMTASDK